MTTTFSNVGAGRRRISRFAHGLRKWLEDADEKRRIRREMEELSRLPEHLLRDMGLERYAVPRDPAIPHHRR